MHKKAASSQVNLFLQPFTENLNPQNPIIQLANDIDWNTLTLKLSQNKRKSTPGQPPKETRLVIGILMLQHMFNFSDENMVKQWVQNPYWQYFCGYANLQWNPPLEASTLTRWRNRLKEKGMQQILSATIDSALKCGLVRKKDLSKVIVDTTVMEKNITHPTDGALLNTLREKLANYARKSGIVLRQSYSKTGKYLKQEISRLGNSRKYTKMTQGIQKMKNMLGSVARDIRRKASPLTLQEAALAMLLSDSDRLLAQTKKSTNKLYSIHEREVRCITKGKKKNRYEFGSKVSLVVTHKQGLVLNSESLENAPFDGHTLSPTLQKAEEISSKPIQTAFVDQGYKGHKITSKQIYISGQRRGMTRSLKRDLKRRAAIEPHIGHMKSDGKLGRSYLKGVEGDKINAVLCGVGHNLRLLLNFLTASPSSVGLKMVGNSGFEES